MGLMEIFRSRFKQFKTDASLITCIYVLGRFVNFWVVLILGMFGRKLFFSKDLYNLEIRNIGFISL